MKLHWTILVALITLAACQLELRKPSSVTTETLVVGYGYPFERHQVQTSDGYLLTIHRIPHSKFENDTTSNRPVAFLMHGLVSASSDWVLLGPDNSLAFLLADAGYDVWLGNARGNVYSRSHIKLNPHFSSFWNFEWHEIGTIDLPTMIDYVLSNTGQDRVRYFGHSQGTTIFFLLNSLDFGFKRKIITAHLFAPVVYMNHMKSPIAKLAGPLFSKPNGWPEVFGSKELLPNTMIQEALGYSICLEESPVQDLCANVLFLADGFDAENLNRTAVPDIISTNPAGSSINQVLHYLQEYKSGYFRQFDYGPARNLHVYKNKEPPNYPIEKIEDLPVFLYYAKNDFFAAVVDVLRLTSVLSNSTLRRAYEVPHPKWNHVDFLWGKNVRSQVYDAVMEDMLSIN